MKKTIGIASTVIILSLITFGITTGKVSIPQSHNIEVAEKAGFG
ncbi:hypothetical protein P4472_02170 [Bacillus subtilis]|nr:hypothetical protein [Bacillus subtilis]MDM5300086.1 hypothetical protein [Bacillus subtilis]MDM5322139.1 hypothetical protein [Bacillus subtilis]MEC0314098.1 hypothetical protein [Bacillus subtilis]MEC0363558.1 hypothetical protein [Bacillus subtilis]MED3600836.1 hypothetical protein [Bacillus subtilis]